MFLIKENQIWKHS